MNVAADFITGELEQDDRFKDLAISPIADVIIPAEGLSRRRCVTWVSQILHADLPLSSPVPSRLSSLSPDAKITLGIQVSLFTEAIRLHSRHRGTPNCPWTTQKSDGHAPEPRCKSSKSYGYAPRSSPEIGPIGVWKFRIQVRYGVLMLSECI